MKAPKKSKAPTVAKEKLLVNLALGRPATQSSLHPDNLLTLEEEAARGVRQEEDEAFFHTNWEWFPWWQVDLEERCEISEVILYNTPFLQHRMRLFTLLVSDDAENWEEVYSRTEVPLFGHTEETACRVKFSQAVVGRYVRIRLNNWDAMHLCRVKVMGCPSADGTAGAEKISGLSNATLAKNTLVFAVNYNEDDIYLEEFIKNFLIYTPKNCHLFINFPAGRKLPKEQLAAQERVHGFNGQVERHKWGGTLLMGHLETYGEALRVLGKFDYFCTIASNQLFVKPFDTAAVIKALVRPGNGIGATNPQFALDLPRAAIPDGYGWMWEVMREHYVDLLDVLGEGGIDYVSGNQIEGLFASASEWNTLYSRMALVEKCNDFFPVPCSKTIALEEILPVTFFRAFGSGDCVNICYMLWSGCREVSFDDLLQFRRRLPDFICQAKWFSRNPLSVTLSALNQSWSRELLETVSDRRGSAGARQRFLNQALADSFSGGFSRQENYVPLTQRWRENRLYGRIQWLGVTHYEKNGSYFPFGMAVPISKLTDMPAAWLKVKQGVAHREHEAVVSEDDNITMLEMRASFSGERGTGHQDGEIETVVFLSALSGNRAQVFRVSLPPEAEFTHRRLMENIRYSLGPSYEDQPWPLGYFEELEGWRHYYFLRPLGVEGEIWIGIPGCLRTQLRVQIAVRSEQL